MLQHDVTELLHLKCVLTSSKVIKYREKGKIVWTSKGVAI